MVRAANSEHVNHGHRIAACQLAARFRDGEGAPASLSDELVSFNGDVVALRRSAPKNRHGELASTRSHLGSTQALGSDTAV